MRERFTMAVGGSAVHRGLHGESFCGLPFPSGFCAQGNRAVRRGFFLAVAAAPRPGEFMSRSQPDATRRDAMRRVARRRPDFELWIEQVL